MEVAAVIFATFFLIECSQLCTFISSLTITQREKWEILSKVFIIVGCAICALLLYLYQLMPS